ncbi:MAG: guanylate kinase [Deltaproteobacteria bacterium]|nr:guanylate kinase [Deltaproteobacteria bacterium]
MTARDTRIADAGVIGTRAPRRGHVFVIAAPSGTGKTTICRRILERDPALRLSTSHTTRKPRAGEQDGVHYHFVTTGRFRELVAEGRFLEHAEYGGNVYGTSWNAIENPLGLGHDVVLEIEVQGAAQVKKRIADACLIFLLPPSLAVLEERLRGRGTDDEAVIQRRMALSDRELAAAEIFDYAVVNDDLERAVEEVLLVIHAVREGQEDSIRARFGRAAVMTAFLAAQARAASPRR